MAKRKVKQLEDAAIIERHALLKGEIALVKQPEGFFQIEMITPRADGTYLRTPMLYIKQAKNRVAARMMDMHAAVCATQRLASEVR